MSFASWCGLGGGVGGEALAEMDRGDAAVGAESCEERKWRLSGCAVHAPLRATVRDSAGLRASEDCRVRYNMGRCMVVG